MAIPYGRVVLTARREIPDGSDEGTIPDTEPATGYVRFSRPAGFVVDPEDPAHVLFIDPVSYGLDEEGVLRDGQGALGVTLAAGWWNVSYDLLGRPIPRPGSFYLEPDVTVDLALITPMAVIQGVQLAQGPPGRGLPGEKGDPGDGGQLASDTTAGVLRLDGVHLTGTGDAPRVVGLDDKLDRTGVLALLREQLTAGSGVQITQAAGVLVISASGGSGGTAVNVVFAGDDPSVPRPNVTGPVLWLCTEEPENDNDAIDYWLPVSATSGGVTGGGTVTSVNGVAPGETGDVVLTPAAVGAQPAGNYVLGDDERLSNPRTPTVHGHTAEDIADTTELGRQLMTAPSRSAARTALGTGAPVLVLTADESVPAGLAAGTVILRRTA